MCLHNCWTLIFHIEQYRSKCRCPKFRTREIMHNFKWRDNKDLIAINGISYMLALVDNFRILRKKFSLSNRRGYVNDLTMIFFNKIGTYSLCNNLKSSLARRKVRSKLGYFHELCFWIKIHPSRIASSTVLVAFHHNTLYDLAGFA